MDGFAPLYEEVRDFVADVAIPHVERMQQEKEEEGLYVDWMEADWMENMKNMIQEEQDGPGDELQAQHHSMLAEMRARRLEGNRARLALEHSMFVEWLQNHDKGHIYEEFRKYLDSLMGPIGAGRHAFLSSLVIAPTLLMLIFQKAISRSVVASFTSYHPMNVSNTSRQPLVRPQLPDLIHSGEPNSSSPIHSNNSKPGTFSKTLWPLFIITLT